VLGFNHLTKATFDFGINEARGALEQHMNFTAGYFYDANFDLQINPTVLVKTDFNEFSFDAGRNCYPAKYDVGGPLV
jgi:hypothetical protein